MNPQLSTHLLDDIRIQLPTEISIPGIFSQRIRLELPNLFPRSTSYPKGIRDGVTLAKEWEAHKIKSLLPARRSDFAKTWILYSLGG